MGVPRASALVDHDPFGALGREQDVRGLSGSAHRWTHGCNGMLVQVSIVAQTLVSQLENEAGPVPTVRRQAKRRSISTSFAPSVSRGRAKAGCHYPFWQARVQML